MSDRPEDDVERDVETRMDQAQEATDAERLDALENVQETLEAELDEGGEAQPPRR